ncbi:MAG: beta-L-arabinofuranosidase domain-containing protein [Actinocatenispora sp.]
MSDQRADTGGTGPVRLPAAGVAALRPLPMRVDGGFWAERQRINRDVSIPDGAEQLDRAGNLHNLQLAAGTATGEYQGDYPFQDSDVHKWLEAVGWELGRAPSGPLRDRATRIIGLLADAQQPDGYLDTYYQVTKPDRRFVELAWGHELYCAGHLIQAAVAWARAAGDISLLDVARRVADRIDAEFGPDARDGVGGHPEIETALVELYRETGQARYLDLAGFFVDRRGHGLTGDQTFGAAYFQDHEPVRTAATVAGHAVRQLYLNAGVTDLVAETDDDRLRAAMLRQWTEMVATRTYLTGGVGAHHTDEAFGDPYELPAERAYCETCAAIASVQWSWRLLLLTGEARFADLIERTLYNGFASGVSLDGRRYFYVNPLQVRDDHQDRGTNREARRTPWYKCACCPPNIMRLLSSLNHYLATADDSGIQVQQYASGTVTAAMPDGTAELRLTTGYPWQDTVQITVTAAPGSQWTLALRVPAWCRDASVRVGGDAAEADVRDGYLRLSRAWRAGETATLTLPMPPRLTVADPRVDAVRGCVAIERGPLVYCLETVDQPAGVRLDDVTVPTGEPLTGRWRPDLLGGVTVVELTGRHHRRRTGSGDWPYPPAGAARPSGEPVSLTAVPYYAWANREPGAMRVWVPSS